MSEMTFEQLCEDSDWGEIFGEGSGGNCTADVESPDGTSTAPVLRKDVAEIIALVNGEGDSEDWAGVFRMTDGRYLAATGGCDYTGWDCQANNTLTVAAMLDAAVSMGLTPENRGRLAEQLDQFRRKRKDRVRLYAVSEPEVLECFNWWRNLPERFWYFDPSGQLPPGACIQRVFHVPERRAFGFVIQHDSFEPVSFGTLLPWAGELDYAKCSAPIEPEKPGPAFARATV